MGRLRNPVECFVTGQLVGKYQAREMGAALVVPESRRQPVTLVEPRETRLVMLVRVALPAEEIHQLLHRFFLPIGHKVKWFDDLHTLYEAIIDLVLEYVCSGKALERPATETTMNVLELSTIRSVIMPFEWLANALSGVIRACDYVLDSMSRREIV